MGSKPAAPTKNPAQLAQLSATLPPRLAGMVFARPAAAQSEQNAAPAALPGAVIPAKARTHLLAQEGGRAWAVAAAKPTTIFTKLTAPLRRTQLYNGFSL